MLPLEKSLIKRLGDAGWMLYFLPRLHACSKMFTIKSPPYRKEAHLMVKRIDDEVTAYFERKKKELDMRKDLPIDNPRHLGRETYMREIGNLTRKRESQTTKFIRDNIRVAAQEVEINLAWDAFEYGMDAYITGDFSLADGSRFMRTYVEQDNPPQANERLASLFHEVRRHMRQRRREWAPGESGYVEEFIRSVKQHYRRLGQVNFWDGVDYRATMEGKTPMPREIRHQANASKLSEDEIVRIMDVMFFKFDNHPEFPLERAEYDRLKGLVVVNYDFESQLKDIAYPDQPLRQFYVKPGIASLKAH